jgi:Domain of unknown function (DUF4868)
MASLEELQAYDLTGADVSVWVFKPSLREGRREFSGRWVSVTPGLATELRTAVRSNFERITETIEYSLLAQNNEGSVLTINSDETAVHLIVKEVANETQARKTRGVKDLENGKFCVAKFVSSGKALLAVRKTDTTWSTRKSSSLVTMVFSDHVLDVNRNPTFTIRPDFDFYILDERIFVRSKPNFESVLAYKASHEAAFRDLQAEPEFAAIFADLDVLTSYVGSNKMHLRRAVVIQQKGHYKKVDFMNKLKAEAASMNLAIVFDENGRIVPTVETVPHIFRALLDHRLDSRLTSFMYDVQNTAKVS